MEALCGYIGQITPRSRQHVLLTLQQRAKWSERYQLFSVGRSAVTLPKGNVLAGPGRERRGSVIDAVNDCLRYCVPPHQPSARLARI